MKTEFLFLLPVLDFSLLTLLLSVAIMLHVTEEFLFPGGFIEWYAEFVPPKTAGVRPGYLVWINTLMMFACLLPFYFGETSRGASIWFSVAVIAAINGCFHVWGMIKLKKYSPGVITGVLLYIPLCITGGWQLISTGDVSIWKAITWLVIAIGYHIFSVFRQGK